MDIQARKLNLIEEFLRISDDVIIEKIETIFRDERKKQSEKALSSMSIEEFHEMINQAKQDQINGRVVSHDELKKRIQSWK